MTSYQAQRVIFEEPLIDNTTEGTWKLLMEGATIMTDIKHSDKEQIKRIPILITQTTHSPLEHALFSIL